MVDSLTSITVIRNLDDGGVEGVAYLLYLFYLDGDPSADTTISDLLPLFVTTAS